MARTARSGRRRPVPWPGGRHDDCHVYAIPPTRPGVVRLRAGRLWRAPPACSWRVLAGGGFWVLATYGKKVVTAPGGEHSCSRPGSRKRWPMPPEERRPRRRAGTPDRSAEHPAPARRPAAGDAGPAGRPGGAQDGGPRPAAPGAKAAPAAPHPRPKPHGSMLFVSHDLKEAADGPKASAYTLAPGATKLPCILETKIISDVEGHFTCRVTTNVYDTATGRHLLVPQGSTVLGQRPGQHAGLRQQSDGHGVADAGPPRWPDGGSGPRPVTDQPGRGGADRAT